MLLEEFNCPTLEQELIEDGYCPICNERTLVSQNIYEDEEGKCDIYECTECGHIIDNIYE